MARKQNAQQTELTLTETEDAKTGILVPAIRKAVADWRKGDYQGTTDTTYRLLNYWFCNDHIREDGIRFEYYAAQREAIETIIYLYEVVKVRRQLELLKYRTHGIRPTFPTDDNFCRYAIKMATGSGKTKVMALTVAWQYLCARREKSADYADTFLLIAPNIIVLERLKEDFAGGRIFDNDPIIPPEMKADWELAVYVRGDGERGGSGGALYLNNIQQLYEREEKPSRIPDAISAVLGLESPTGVQSGDGFIERIVERSNCMVLNDEGHHTHNEESVWNGVIGNLHQRLAEINGQGIVAQFDFSATPRHTKGELFEWVVYDYPLKRAIKDGIVKWPIKGEATGIKEEDSDNAATRYQPYLVAGVERWQEYRDGLKPINKKPVLFIMMHTIQEAEDVADWLREEYSSNFGKDSKGREQLLVIRSSRNGDMNEEQQKKAREDSRRVDEEDSPVNCIVSVMMLREGWDVRNVTVIVGLRPYSSKAQILPEQTVGRGLRLITPGPQHLAINPLTKRQIPGETVDIIGSDGFLKFVGDLEKLENVSFDSFTLGKDHVNITIIQPLTEHAEYDIEVPFLSPRLKDARIKPEVIKQLDIDALETTTLMLDDFTEEGDGRFGYQGTDMIEHQKIVEREYQIPRHQSAQDFVRRYTQLIRKQLKLPAEFDDIALKVYEFAHRRLFGWEVDMDDKLVIGAIGSLAAKTVITSVFIRKLTPYLSEKAEAGPIVYRKLSSVNPFRWIQLTQEAEHTVYNLAACQNELERSFADFLDSARDVQAFAKIPDSFKFSMEYLDDNNNLHHYFPDFIARQMVAGQTDGFVYWVLETKGREDDDVKRKDKRAREWAIAATEATGQRWRYLKVPEKEFYSLNPTTLRQLAAALEAQLQMTV